jgi:hypothetical protein
MIGSEGGGPRHVRGRGGRKALEGWFLANRLALCPPLRAGPNFKKLGKIVPY